MTQPAAEFVREFGESMPPRYRKSYDPNAIAAHARIALERGSSACNIGAFHSSRAPGTALCVVAEDRPGLLALISAALVMTGLDVMDAEAYTREPGGGKAEAVDVFWVRHAEVDERKARVSKEEIAKLRDTLADLIEGRRDPQQATPSQRTPAIAAGTGTVVRFLEGEHGKLTTLEVETSDRSGLLLALSSALYQQRVQIVASAVRTVDERVFDRFDIVELDGSFIGAARRLEIQVAVMSAVQPVS